MVVGGNFVTRACVSGFDSLDSLLLASSTGTAGERSDAQSVIWLGGGHTCEGPRIDM